MADDRPHFIKEFIHIAASSRVRGGQRPGCSTLFWGLFVGGAILASWLAHPFFLIGVLIASLAFIVTGSGYFLYRRWRKKLAASPCPACSVVIGREAAAQAFAEHARECRQFVSRAGEGAFVDFPGAEGLVFRCPACATDLSFHCHGPGDISLWEDPEQEDAPAS
ncbi:hypothetical protein [Haloferula sp. BvORR071]|uniref:hypothetical protein n=1 Tax=Haloferula sp. BvORR071 TaxID=1396141 RepID=UPI00054F425F|nr:hypothetical protein [Haloferula sp. BvORR071]